MPVSLLVALEPRVAADAILAWLKADGPWLAVCLLPQEPYRCLSSPTAAGQILGEPSESRVPGCAVAEAVVAVAAPFLRQPLDFGILGVVRVERVHVWTLSPES